LPSTSVLPMIVSLLAEERSTRGTGDPLPEEAYHHQEDVTEEHSFDDVCQEGEDCCGERCVPVNTEQNCGCCGCGCLETEQCVFNETLQGHICAA
jgi:hypothetical protein